MKKTIIILFSIVFLCLGTGNRVMAKGPDSLSCLLVGGSFAIPSYSIKGMEVALFIDNDIVKTEIVNGDKDFAFVLKRNYQYTIRISKEGYITRYITIDTSLPDEVSAAPLFVFEFVMEMKKTMPGVDDYYLDFPIAHVKFNRLTDKFDYSRKYTTFMKEQLKKSESDFKLTKSR